MEKGKKENSEKTRMEKGSCTKMKWPLSCCVGVGVWVSAYTGLYGCVRVCASGSAAGVGCWVPVYPIDVVKTQIQNTQVCVCVCVCVCV